MARALTCAGAHSGDMVHNAYGYGLFTGGLGAHYGAERLGATVIPVSGGNTKRQITIMKDFRSTVLLSTPSYALNLADIIINHEMGNDKPWPQDMHSDVPLKSPWGAVARSAMLPGWGQCYNESYIKSILALGAFSYFAYRIYDYERHYRQTDDVSYRDKRVTNTWYLGFTYVLILLDSYIDAYLYKFDETIQFSYQYKPVEKTFTLGVNVVF